MRFIENMLKFRLVFHPRIVFEVLQICYRHLWYIVPQTVVFALVDTGLTDDQRERMAVRLHSSERVEISSGKPEFPYVDWSGIVTTVPDLSSFITADSWLTFDMLGLTGNQDWLLIPARLWDRFAEFRRLKEFVTNLSICNDIAERGVALITSHIHMAESEE